ncbi:unnamed protein product [Prorocentrum cordatum]|uniref:Uncharacterized protein n=1 Tax=Prorocentrum cordatum TaxID=2364126 RepID=A0ABN9X477_9DINO|nr:unnamed protein product [Polarella glacialis]
MNNTQIFEPATLLSKMKSFELPHRAPPAHRLERGGEIRTVSMRGVGATWTGGLHAEPIAMSFKDASAQEALPALNFNINDAERSTDKSANMLWEVFERLKSVAQACSVAAVDASLRDCTLQFLQIHTMAQKPAGWVGGRSPARGFRA